MYDVRQFKPVLYALLLLGLTGFGIAAEAPGIWLLGTCGVLLNAWLVHSGRFVPMPRLLANVVTLGCMTYIAAQMVLSAGTPVLIIGEFLVLLHLVKLWEQRANRDYAQLLVISLLLMVASAINTAGLGFGLLLVLYLFLSLYCCVLFHVKADTDAARQIIGIQAGKITPAALRQDQRYFSRSMRRMTAVISSASLIMAVAVFLLFPRGSGANMFGGVQLRPSQALTGFSDQVSFDQVARISQNSEIVAHVQLYHNNVRTRLAAPLLLRGMTLDHYRTDTRSPGRSRWVRQRDFSATAMGVDAYKQMELERLPADDWRQHIALKPTGTSVLFALPGLAAFTPYRDVRVRYNQRDSSLMLNDIPQQVLEYDVTSSNELGPRPNTSAWNAMIQNLGWQISRGNQARPAGLPDSIRSRVLAYARRPEVSGADAQGPLAAQRQGVADRLDETIARNIEHHLQTEFAYTLDLTGSIQQFDEDPLVTFLYNLKKGHCEYFAGAMALMCQTLGMEARVVIGFKCDEYNDFNDQYIVRQAHAHAWVEVLTARGWLTFDPTSGQDPRNQQTQLTLAQKIKHLFDFLEFTYAQSVIAYDNENRENLIQNVENKMLNTAIQGNMFLARLRDWFDSWDVVTFWNLSSTLLAAAVFLTVAGLVAFVVWFLWERWMLYRRATRIGLESLSPSDQKRLARQLGFYDDLLKLLDRHHIHRAAHFTPLEFSRSLNFLPSQAYETISRLTEIFYRIRFGGADLTPGQRQKLERTLARLEQQMPATR